MSQTFGNFTFTPTTIPGVTIIDCKTFGDNRGYFVETYKQPDFALAGIDDVFVQDNQSSSTKGVLRGLHFQIEHPQAKLVRVLEGKVFDVCVDLRSGSPTFGQWECAILSSNNHRQFYIPKGFAHGFYVLSELAVFAYKCDDIYRPNDEGGIKWDDPDIGIRWPLSAGEEPELSNKDRHHPSFAQWCALRKISL